MAKDEALSHRIGPGAWVRSFPTAVRDLATGRTRCWPMQVGSSIRLPDGQTYDVFRNTRRALQYWGPEADATVLVPRFHLRLLPARRRRLHALFRSVCIGTTPFFVGIRGFRSKLWMEDPATGDFAAIYEWDDEATARAYAAGLAQVLRPLSTPGSVSYEIVPCCRLADFLDLCRPATVGAPPADQESAMQPTYAARAARDAARREDEDAAAEERLAQADRLAAEALESPARERAAHRVAAREHAASAAAHRRAAALHRLEAETDEHGLV